MAIRKAECDSEQVVMIDDCIDNHIAHAESLGRETICSKQGLSQCLFPTSAEQDPNFKARRLDAMLHILL